MKESKVKSLARIAIIASLYVAITLITYPISYSAVQFRISECLVLLTFFNKKYGIGVTIGVFIANFFNNAGFTAFDIIFGTLSTAVAVIMICFTKHLFIASLCPFITSIIVVLEIVWALDLPFFETALGVMIPMFIIECVIGYTIFKILSKNKGFLRYINCERMELLEAASNSTNKKNETLVEENTASSEGLSD